MAKTETNKTKVIKAETFLLKGKVKFARLHTPQKGGKIKEVDKVTGEEAEKQLPDTYSLNLVIDEDNRDEVLDRVDGQALSRKPKRDKERDEVLGFTRNVEYGPEGQILNPLQYVVDEYGESIPPTTLVGNGSMCTIAYRLSQYNTSFGKRNKAILVGVQVHDLVPFERPVIQEDNPFTNKERKGNPF